MVSNHRRKLIAGESLVRLKPTYNDHRGWNGKDCEKISPSVFRAMMRNPDIKDAAIKMNIGDGSLTHALEYIYHCCFRKISYATEQYAKVVADKLGNNVYCCSVCKKYHHGSIHKKVY